MKKLFCIILAVSLTLCVLCTPAFSASTIRISDAVYPSEIKAGNPFSVSGIVTSDSVITSVTGSVYSSNGTLQFTKTDYPNAKSYSIEDMDVYLTFGRLSIGSYTYKIVASNASEKNAVLLSKSFNVVSESGITMKITDYNYPTSISLGRSFSISGVVTSTNTLKSVTVGIYTTDGTAKIERSANPGTASYDIYNLDYYITFGKLAKGTYVYKVTATDSVSYNVVLLQKTFSVVGISGPEENLDSVFWNVIDLSYYNDVYSWDKVEDNVDGVILRVGYRGTGGSRSIGADSKFAGSYKAAAAKNLHIGCYFFSNALNTAEAEAEADFVLKKLKENNCKLDLPVYFDMETDAQYNLSQSACTQVARAFCSKIAANGYYAGIYCSKYFALDELYADQLSDIPFWIAQYASHCDYSGPYGMWQYSENGYIPGIDGDVDLDFCYYDYPSYIKANGLSGYIAAPPVVVTAYKVKEVDGIKVDETGKLISAVPAGFDTGSFIKTYIEYSSDLSVVFGNTVGGNIATGTTVTFKKGDSVLAAYTVSVAGDVDSNGVINSSDALIALQHSVGTTTLSGVRKISADITGDGIINSSDALEILTTAVRS